MYLFLRRFCKEMFKARPSGVRGFSLSFRGKLAVTGNKRKRSMVFFHGFGNSINHEDYVHTHYFILRTTTGVVGCKSVLVI